MTTASDTLEQHLQTLVGDPEQWQTLIADDIVWELAYAPGDWSSGAADGRGGGEGDIGGMSAFVVVIPCGPAGAYAAWQR